MKTKILYLEDENYLGRIVKESLGSRGYNIRLVTDGATVMRNFEQFQPDICVLDVMVPNVDGFTLGKFIKAADPKMPIIFLTAKNQTQDVLEGFSSGGNDFIKKPFSMEELIVRIENILLLNNQRENKQESVKLGLYTFEPEKFLLSLDDEIHKLSHRENELLKLFAQHVNQQIDRKLILKSLWGDDSIYNSRNLDVYIRKLRVYFEGDPRVKLVTLRGVGYYLSIE